ncbi:aminoacyl-tRNA hydrolase [Candidatus Marinimicrobia bacterium]|jgi:PTH1 family peptidyl-tRNA hydrolase|nr:aminoacyl-tRNA hydrolase [Candidatus Neomarinimicrobiota bacterium]
MMAKVSQLLKVAQNKVIAYVGLGNPGVKYSNTKHNAGYWVVDEWAKRHRLIFKPGKGSYLIAKDKRHDVLIIKPTSGMNLSGSVVKEVSKEWNLLPLDIYVVVDDVDLPLGKIRIKPKGGDGCHRGMENIIYCLKTNFFPRLRIGIATEQNMRPAEKYVLKPFRSTDLNKVKQMINAGTDALDSILNRGINYSMNKYNS